MGGANDVLPLLSRKLIARKYKANVVVQNFRSGSGKSVKPVVAQHIEVIPQHHARQFDTIDNFHGREGVNGQARNGRLHGAQNIAVIEGVESAWEPALNTHLGCSELPGFDSLFGDLLRFEKVGVRLARATAEGAELAPDKTDV